MKIINWLISLKTKHILKFQRMFEGLPPVEYNPPPYDASKIIFHHLIYLHPNGQISFNYAHMHNLIGNYFATAIKESNNDVNTYVKWVDVIDANTIRIYLNQVPVANDNVNVIIIGVQP